MAPVTPVTIHLEPMQAADLEAVMLIEHQSFSMPWSVGLFRSELTRPTSHLLVARL